MQHETRKHARLSASRTDRFMQCPGSYRLESLMPYEPAGEAAAIGTAIHELSELILSGKEVPTGTDQDHVAMAKAMPTLSIRWWKTPERSSLRSTYMKA